MKMKPLFIPKGLKTKFHGLLNSLWLLIQALTELASYSNSMPVTGLLDILERWHLVFCSNMLVQLATQ